METVFIPDDNGRGFTRGFIAKDVEFVDPLKYYTETEIQKHKIKTKDLLNVKSRLMTSMISDEWFTKVATEKWENQLEIINKVVVPPNFIELVSDNLKKKKQIQLLKRQTLSPLQQLALFFKAAKDFGYTYSAYHVEKDQSGIDDKEKPTFVSVKNDGTVHKAGGTSLSDGQLRKLVSDRRVVISKFLDNEDQWHCFFQTFRSLRGEESWNHGQPHFHYISDKWGISREDAVKLFKGDRYPTTNVHIGIAGYQK